MRDQIFTCVMKNSDDIAAVLEATMGPESKTPEIAAFVLQAARLLSTGNPIDPADVAMRIGLPPDRLKSVLANLRTTSQLEYAQDGHLIAVAGLTLRPSSHVLRTPAITLYTWCAVDALFFPDLLGQSVQVTSPCPISGQMIHVKIDQDKQSILATPESACVSIVVPDLRRTTEQNEAGLNTFESDACVSDGCDADELFGASGTFCSRVSFFNSPKEAEEWTEGMSDIIILPVSEAYKLAIRVWASPLKRQARRFKRAVISTD
jgi:alkylmercury lyase